MKSAGRASLANGNEPNFTTLPEADRADMEVFTEYVRLILPVLGFDIAKETASVATPVSTPKMSGPPEQASPIFRINSVGVDARMSVAGDEYVVHKDSTARADAKAAQNTYRPLRDQLLKEGVLVPNPQDPTLLIFTKDVPFKSLSAAAAIVLDRNAAGPREWKLEETKMSYGDWQQRQL